MGIGSIGVPSLILILIVALLIFGHNKLPELGKAVGESLKGFKDATNSLMSDHDEESKKNKDDTEE